MGVTNLWKLVEKYHSTVKLNELRGQYIAIDLSTWIIESQQKFKSIDSAKNVYKPYLRILYQRISRLIKCGVIPFVVADSYKINKLKLGACERRRENDGYDGGGSNKKKARTQVEDDSEIGRKQKNTQISGNPFDPSNSRGDYVDPANDKTVRFKYSFMVRECQELLQKLGVRLLTAPEGVEAECIMAMLEKRGLVDACLTTDGDCFLYGSRNVIKTLNLSKSQNTGFLIDTSELEIYKIPEQYPDNPKLTYQEVFITAAFFMGCDYYDGIKGIGYKRFLGILGETGKNIFEIFRDLGKQSRFSRSATQKNTPVIDDSQYSEFRVLEKEFKKADNLGRVTRTWCKEDNCSLLPIDFCEVVSFLEKCFQLERKAAFNKVFEIYVYKCLFADKFRGHSQKSLFEVVAKVKRNGVASYRVVWELDSVGLRFNFGSGDIDLEVVVAGELMEECFKIDFVKKTGKNKGNTKNKRSNTKNTKNTKNKEITNEITNGKTNEITHENKKRGNILDTLALDVNNRITKYFSQSRVRGNTKRQMVRHNSENNLSILEGESVGPVSSNENKISVDESFANLSMNEPDQIENIDEIKKTGNIENTEKIKKSDKHEKIFKVDKLESFSIPEKSSNLNSSLNVTNWLQFDFEEFSKLSISRLSISRFSSTLDDSCHMQILDASNLSAAFGSQQNYHNFSQKENTNTYNFTPISNRSKRKSIFQSSPLQEMQSSTPTSKMNLYKTALKKVAVNESLVNSPKVESKVSSKGLLNKFLRNDSNIEVTSQKVRKCDSSIILLDSSSSEDQQTLPNQFKTKKCVKRARMSTSVLLIEDDSFS